MDQLPGLHRDLRQPAGSSSQMAQPSCKVLLIDDHELVRVGVKTCYGEVDGVRIDWLEASSLQEGLAVYEREQKIELVLLDLNLADCKGLQGLRLFVQAYPAARVAVFSATHDEFVVRQARALGAAAYVPKNSVMVDMQQTLAALLWSRGSAQQARWVTGRSAVLFPHTPSSAIYDRVDQLGPRHLEILELVLSGCTNQEISTAMKFSLGTVKNYVSSLLLALDVKSRSHLISLFR